MKQLDTDQLRSVLTAVVENGDIWAQLLPEHQEAAMAQFIRLENEALASADACSRPYVSNAPIGVSDD